MSGNGDFRILGWLEEVNELNYDSDELPAEVFSDSDGEVEQQIQNTDSEQSNDGDDELQLNPQIRPDNVLQVNRANAITYTSKDRLINWYAHDPTPSTNTRTVRQNILNILTGVKHVARDKSTILDCWQFYFPNGRV